MAMSWGWLSVRPAAVMRINLACCRAAMSFEPVQVEENGVSYVADGAVALYWHSEGGAARYDIEITDEWAKKNGDTLTVTIGK